MQGVKEKLVPRLKNDATLQGLLDGEYVYHGLLPERPHFPCVTYTNTTSTLGINTEDVQCRDETYTFTAWGDNFEAILSRIYELLNNWNFDQDSGDVTNAIVYMCRWDWESPDLYDDIYHKWYKQARYRMLLRRANV